MSVPRLHCPPAVVYDYFNSSDIQVEARYPDVPATDNVAISRVEFDPPNGTTVFIHHIVMVTVTAWDSAENKATCSFLYQAERE